MYKHTKLKDYVETGQKQRETLTKAPYPHFHTIYFRQKKRFTYKTFEL